jgi:hypothetical protein
MISNPPTKVWRRWIAELREKCPTDGPVRVVRRKLKSFVVAGVTKGLCGYCLGVDQGEGDGYLIVVNSSLSRPMQQETLLHEWAHALSGRAQKIAGEENHHGPLWGLAYAAVSRAFNDVHVPVEITER